MNARNALAQRKQAVAKQGDGIESKVWQMESAFQLAMPKGGEAQQLIRDALTCLRNTPNLTQCEERTVLGGLMTCAQLGLRPGVNGLGHAWLLPFKAGKTGTHKAQLVIGYQGMIELSQRSGRIASLIGRVVYENDEFSVDYGLNERLVHRPEILGERGPVVAYYAIARFVNGGSAFWVLSKPDAEEARQRSKTANNGPWVTDFDSMAVKTAMRRLWKWLPKSTEMAIAEAVDEGVRVDYSPDADAAESTVIDGEVADDEPSTATGEPAEEWPAVAEPGSGGQ